LHFWNAPMLSELYEDSSSKNWCARPSRVQNRFKVLREISGVPSSRECRFRAKEPSLINAGYAFFDEIPLNFPKPQRRKQETVCWFKLGWFRPRPAFHAAMPWDTCSIFAGARLDFDVLKRVRLSRPALINGSPFS
jgi:hypothetical protein